MSVINQLSQSQLGVHYTVPELTRCVSAVFGGSSRESQVVSNHSSKPYIYIYNYRWMYIYIYIYISYIYIIYIYIIYIYEIIPLKRDLPARLIIATFFRGMIPFLRGLQTCRAGVAALRHVSERQGGMV